MKEIKLTIFVVIILAAFGSVSLSVIAKESSAKAPGQVKKQFNMGNVQTIEGNTLTIDNDGLDDVQADVSSGTRLVGQNKKTLKLNQIKPKDLVAIISDDSTDSAKPKKALKVFVKSASDSAQLSRRAVMGIVSAINGSTLTLVHQTQRDRTFNILFNTQTVIKSKDPVASGSAQLQVGQRVVAVGAPSATGLLARWIHIIPGKATATP